MKQFTIIFFCLALISVSGQENISYQQPPDEILELVDVQLAPTVLLDDNKEFMILRYRDAYKTIEGLSQEELRLGGLRIDPKTNIGSRVTYYNNIKIKSLKENATDAFQIEGLLEQPKLANFRWSPDQKKMAFTHTTSTGVEVWILDIIERSASILVEANVNANMGDIINWFENSEAILVKMISSNRKDLIDVKSAIPTGPTISVSDGKKAQNRTYQDLLKNKNDEYNFEQLALSEIYKINLDGTKAKWLGSAMYDDITFSPDGNYIMVNTVEKPFSYLVPYYRFPSKTVIYDKDADLIKTIIEVPLIEDLPKGFMAVRKGMRSLRWRNDKPSSLVYAEALDEGDPEIEVDFRDEVFQIDAPFNDKPISLLKTINRFSGIQWASENIAIASDYWWNTRNTKSYVFNPSDPSLKPELISDRNYQDRYSDPGNFVTKKNEFGSRVIYLDGSDCYLTGDGYSEEGQFPFVDRYSLKSKETKRLYQSEFTDMLENIYDYDPDNSSPSSRWYFITSL